MKHRPLHACHSNLHGIKTETYCRLGVLASAASAACVVELSRCVGPCVVDVLTVWESAVVVVTSAARRFRSSSIDGCPYDSWASIADVPPADPVASTFRALSAFGADTSTDFDIAAADVAAAVPDVTGMLVAPVVLAPVDTTEDSDGCRAVDNDDGNSPTAADDAGRFALIETLTELKNCKYKHR